MSVTIKRKTGGAGAGSKISIKLNGEKVAKIAHQQKLELDIQDESAIIKVEQLGVTSNEITVKNEDVVEIRTAKITYLTVLSLLVYIIISSFDQMAAYASLSRIFFIILFVCNFFLFDGFRLRIMNAK